MKLIGSAKSVRAAVGDAAAVRTRSRRPRIPRAPPADIFIFSIVVSLETCSEHVRVRSVRSDGGGQRVGGGGRGGARAAQAEAGQQGGARADGAGVPAVRVAGGHPALRVLRVRVDVAGAAPERQPGGSDTTVNNTTPGPANISTESTDSSVVTGEVTSPTTDPGAPLTKPRDLNHSSTSENIGSFNETDSVT